jgi:hypothetical protein
MAREPLVELMVPAFWSEAEESMTQHVARLDAFHDRGNRHGVS